jgi:hypothetical protein
MYLIKTISVSCCYTTYVITRHTYTPVPRESFVSLVSISASASCSCVGPALPALAALRSSLAFVGAEVAAPLPSPWRRRGFLDAPCGPGRVQVQAASMASLPGEVSKLRVEVHLMSRYAECLNKSRMTLKYIYFNP